MTLELRREIEAVRPAKSPVQSQQPNAVWIESEPVGGGNSVECLTILLAVNECPWRCAMCDLWKQTLDTPTQRGAIPNQIRWALESLDEQVSSVRWIKLYNSGSFFDPHSIPAADWEAIGKLTARFERVVVENHPRLCDERVEQFRRFVVGDLEVALGVESVQPGLLRRLNKGMHRGHVDQAIQWLTSRGILSRAFLMQRPPWNQEQEAVRWTQLSVRHLAAIGTDRISIIPARAGNGWMDKQQQLGHFSPPTSGSMEAVLRWALHELTKLQDPPVVTVDLWDWPPAKACTTCADARKQSIESMNLTQLPAPATRCEHCDSQQPDPLKMD